MRKQQLAIACSAALGVSLAAAGMWKGNLFAQQAPQPAIAPVPLIEPGQAAPAPQGISADPVGSADRGDEVPLGETFESQSAGISFRPPASCRLSDTMSSKYIAEWADAEHQWTLKLGKMVLDQPAPLRATKNNFGDKQVEGILDKTVRNLQASLPGCEVLRHDVTNTRDNVRFDATHPRVDDNVGMIAIRYSVEGQHKLSQQAIIQAGDGLYYLLTLTSPGNKAPLDKPDVNTPPDPNEVLAVNTFGRMIDSVRMLDREAILKDQYIRLFHARTAIVNWTPERLRKALINEQWLRIIKNGKDVGYSYITEDQSGGIPRPLKPEELKAAQKNHDNGAELRLAPKGDGILVGVRSGMVTTGIRTDKTKGPIQTDSALWLYVSSDKKHEDFTRMVVTDQHLGTKKGFIQEFGLSDKRVRRVVEHAQEDPAKRPANRDAINLDGNVNEDHGLVSYKEDWELNVTMASNSGNAEPLVRKLPPWYVPQALAHLLPRLLPLDRPQGYLFATYVSDSREVMMRYIDVLPEQNIVFNGQPIRAVPISDRLGLQGSVTMHYMSIDGNYLGSENKEQKLVLLPSNDTTIQRIWSQTANLTRPDGVERNAPANADAVNPR